jgi:hypothetical protein
MEEMQKITEYMYPVTIQHSNRLLPKREARVVTIKLQSLIYAPIQLVIVWGTPYIKELWTCFVITLLSNQVHQLCQQLLSAVCYYSEYRILPIILKENEICHIFLSNPRHQPNYSSRV